MSTARPATGELEFEAILDAAVDAVVIIDERGQIQRFSNYADMWQRHFAPFGLERGINSLWSDGGAMYALPFR